MATNEDDVLVGMIRCYLNKTRVSWPWLALLFGALAFIVAAPLVLR